MTASSRATRTRRSASAAATSRRREVTPAGVTCTLLGAVDPAIADWAGAFWDAEIVDGKPVIVKADDATNTLKLWQPPPSAPDAAPVPAPAAECGPFVPQLVRSGTRGHERVLLSFGCYHSWEAGAWDPAATPRWSIQDFGPALRREPLGLLGSLPAVVAEVDSPDSTPTAELQLASGFKDRLLFRPRGTDDVATFATQPGPGGLPQVAVAAGASAADPNGTYIQGFNLFLVRVHP